jgi:FkbM family methyltransferase
MKNAAGRMRNFSQRILMAVFQPYISRELPGWGRVYSALIGGYHRDAWWSGHKKQWVRGKLHGYEMLLDLGQWSNRSTYFLKRLYDLPTQLVLIATLRSGDTFLDVGANEGMISLLGSRLVGPSGKVIAFEPNPRPRSILQDNIDRNHISNVTIMPIGLGEKDESLSLSVPKINTGEGSFGRTNYSSELVEIVKCDVRRGDDLLTTVSPRLIKIDVEGFELYVLRGMKHLISKDRPAIIMEMDASHLARTDTRVEDLVAFLQDRSYRPFLLGLQKRGWKYALKLTATSITSNIAHDVLWMHSENQIIIPSFAA